MHCRGLSLATLTLIGSLLVVYDAMASVVPLTIHLDGSANSQTTGPLDGTFLTRFRLYQGGDPQTGLGGELVYEESANLPYDAGLFSHELGTGTAAPSCGSEETCMFTEDDFETSDPMHLELAIIGEVLLPWFDISSVPFAIRSARVNSIDGAQAGRIEAGPTGLLKIVDGAQVLNGSSIKVSELDINVVGAGAITTYGPNQTQNVRLSSLSGGDNNGWLGIKNDLGEDRVRMYAGSADVGVAVTHSPNGSLNTALGYLTGVPDHGYVWVSDANNNERAAMSVDGNGSGSVRTYGANGFGNVEIGYVPGSDNDGYVAVYDDAGLAQIELSVDGTGEGLIVGDKLTLDGPADDATVNLPDNTISAVEILDEPGLSSNVDIANTPLTSSTFQDLVTTTITIPADGYIIVRGQVSVTMIKTGGPGSDENIYAQIDETTGGSINSPSAAMSGTADATIHSGTMITERIYYKTAGAYTFRMEARRDPLGSGYQTNASFPHISSLYVPTSYGSVITTVSTADDGKMESAELLPAMQSAASESTPGQSFKVDLRELELRASRAKADAERAQREYLEARLKSATGEQSRGTIGDVSEGRN